MSHSGRGVWQTLALCALMLACIGATPATAADHDPTRLRLVAEQAGRVISDGERWVVVSVPSGPEGASWTRRAYDTWTGARSSLPVDCDLAGSLEQTTTLTAGRALMQCERGFVVYDLATGEETVLPREVRDGMRVGRELSYEVLGRRWVRASGSCEGFAGSSCYAYVEFASGAARLFESDARGGSRAARLRDLDAPGLPVRRACRPELASPSTLSEYLRLQDPPTFVGRGGLRRCRDGRLLRALPRGPLSVDLASGFLSWGDPMTLRARASVHVYDVARKRTLSWRLPPAPGHRRVAGSVVHTKCEVFTSTTLGLTDDGYVTDVRVHRAPLPRPRSPRCRR